MTQDTSRLIWGAIFGAIVAVAIVACVDDSDEIDPKSEQTTVSRGMITASMNKYIESGSIGAVEQFGLMGMFARYDGEKSSTVDNLLGSWTSDMDLAMDTCTLPERVLEEVPHSYSDSESAIELLDVGNLSISFEDVTKPIPTRTFPDLLKVIVGVIYATDESKGVHFSPGAMYTIKATGTDSVDSFRVPLEAPEDLGDVAINGILPEQQVPVIERGEDVELSWEGERYSDEVIATLSWMSLGAPWSMTCKMKDDGVFFIPARITRALPDPLTVEDEELVIRRVRQTMFTSEGLSRGSFRFVVSTNFRVEM